MSKLVWDQTGERFYETGVDHGVIYPYIDGEFKNGEAWNGLTAVNENPSGAEPNAIYADNIKYLNLMSAEDFGCGIECYTYPDSFAECNGEREVAPGMSIGQQTRKLFGFCFRTLKGNDTDGTDHGYILNLVYNCLASPSERAHSTVNDSPEAASLSFDLSTTPVNVTGYKPTAVVKIDSNKTDAAKLAALEDILYGTTLADPRLPMPDEIATLVGGDTVPSITLDKHYVAMTTTGSATLVATTVPASSTVTWSAASDSVCTVSNGVITPAGAGNTIVTASITEDGVTYNDTCTVVVTSAT